MTQRDLNRAVAAATGESVGTIERMGFGPLDDDAIDEDIPHVLDWDATDDSRLGTTSGRQSQQAAFA
jgi:hypothetical protein